jgi:hypothetical protein
MKTFQQKVEAVKSGSRGTIWGQNNGATMYLLISGYKQFDWIMVSDKTGNHCITTDDNRPNERVRAHWAGFIKNQNS